MKLRKVLAGILSAAIVLTSIPVSNLPVHAAADGQGVELAVEDPLEADGSLSVEDPQEVLDETPDVPAVYTAESNEEEIDVLGVAADHSNIRTSSEKNPPSNSDGFAWWAFDHTGANKDNWWHSNYIDVKGQPSDDNPVWIEAGLGDRKSISKLTYEGRGGDNPLVGKIKKYEVLAADFTPTEEKSAPDDSDFAVVSAGVFGTSAGMETVTFPAVAATHIRLQVYSVQEDGNNAYVVAKHIRIFEDTSMQPETAKQILTLAASKKGDGDGTVSITRQKMVDGMTASVQLHAAPADGSLFQGWEQDGHIVSHEADYALELTASAENTTVPCTAVFQLAGFGSRLDVLESTIRANSETPAGGQYPLDGPASYAFNYTDDNPTRNHWHSNYDDGHVSAANPVWIEAGFGTKKNVRKIVYLPRQNSDAGQIKDCEILAANMSSPAAVPSDDDYAHVTYAQLPSGNKTQERVIILPVTVEATHIRIKVTSTQTDNDHVTASKIEFYESLAADDIAYQIVPSTNALTAEISESSAGRAHVSPAYVVKEIDSPLTLTPEANEGYAFEKWVLPDGTEDTEHAVLQVTANTEHPVSYTLHFTSYNPNSHAQFWERERTSGNMAQQTDDDIWHYQVRENGVWSDLPGNAYTPDASFPDGSYGKWMEGVNGYHYAKIAQHQITTTLDEDSAKTAIGYRWKASEPGYYYMTLENDITGDKTTNTSNDTFKLELAVHYLDKTISDKADGKLLWEGNVYRSQKNFTSGIAKMEAGDYLRLVGKRKDTWALGFDPIVKKATVQQYAAQRAAEVGRLLDDCIYDEAGTAAIREKVTALTSLSSESEDAAVEHALTELENAIANAKVIRSVTYSNPTVGTAFAPSDEDMKFFDNANALTFDILFKYDSHIQNNTKIPLATISDGQGNFLSAWLTPNGAVSLDFRNVPGGLVWSGKFARQDDVWHKYTLMITRDHHLHLVVDGAAHVSNFHLPGWSNPNATASSAKIHAYTKHHNWPVKEVSIGAVPAHSDGATVLGSASPEHLQVKYLRISGESCTATETLNKNNEATFANDSEEKTAYANIQSDIETLSADNYTDEAWGAFQTAIDGHSGKTVDREVLNSTAALQAAKETLLPNKAAKVTVSGRLTGSSASVPEDAVSIQDASQKSVKVALGTGVTVTAQKEITVPDGEGQTVYLFDHWTDGEYNRAISTALEYTLYPYVPMNLTAVYEKKEADVQTAILFKTPDKFSGMRWDAAMENGSITTPKAPFFIGYTFDGWVSTDGENPVTLAEDTVVSADDLGGHTVFEAVYTATDNYWVTFSGCSSITTTDEKYPTISTDTADPVLLAANTRITVISDDENFSYWSVNGKAVSYNKSYTFVLKGGTDGNEVAIAAVLNETIEEVKPLAAFQYAERTRDTDVRDVAKVALVWDVPDELSESIEVVEIGMLRTYADASFDETLLSIDNSSVKRSRCSKTGPTGSYTLSIGISGGNYPKTMYVKGYIVYRKDGIQHVEYTTLATLHSSSAQ